MRETQQKQNTMTIVVPDTDDEIWFACIKECFFGIYTAKQNITLLKKVTNTTQKQ